MSWRIYDFHCSFCLVTEERLVEIGEDGECAPQLCSCEERCVMVKQFSPPTAPPIWGNGFWRGQHPRRIEITMNNEDGTKSHLDVTHTLGTQKAPGEFTTKDD